MSKHRVAVLKVVSRQLSATAAASEYGMSRQHLQRLLRRYRDGGLDALEPRSRRPHSNPSRTPFRRGSWPCASSSAQGHEPRLNGIRRAAWVAVRTPRARLEGIQATVPIATQQALQVLAAHPVLACSSGRGQLPGHDLEDGHSM